MGKITIPTEKERTDMINESIDWRLDNVLLDLMREQEIDMWLIINREWIEDPVFFTFVHQPMMGSPGCVALFFHDQGGNEGLRRYSCSPHGRLPGYEEVWHTRKKTQFAALAEGIAACDPQRIGINKSDRWGYGDGLTASLYDDLENAIGPELAGRFVSAGDLCVRWLETRSRQELTFYRHACEIAHELIREAFSPDVVVPGTTTTDDLVWWFRQRISGLGLQTWFQPSFSLVRPTHETTDSDADSQTIRPGDLIHSDFGIEYCGICTDMQWWAYVLRPGEKQAPAGLRNAFDRATKVADIFMNEFVAGKTGYEIAFEAKRKAESLGLEPTIYTHPIGVHGHGAGTTFNTVPAERQDERNVLRWNYPLYINTCYAIELSCRTKIPEWDDQEISMGIEESAVFDKNGCRYIDGSQTDLLLI